MFSFHLEERALSAATATALNERWPQEMISPPFFQIDGYAISASLEHLLEPHPFLSFFFRFALRSGWCVVLSRLRNADLLQSVLT